MPEPALYTALPALRDAIPWQPLGRFPTRVHRLDGLAPPSVELWIKRDDESAASYGGNKVRKLEFLLAEAAATGRTRLLTIGGFGSHHVLATAVHGRAAGFSVEAVVFPQPITAHVRATLLADAAAGATLHAGSLAGVPWRWARARRGRHWIAAGGSSPTGTLGYVDAALELRAQQDRGECPAFDAIYVALGSCGTAAGLLLGCQLAGLSPRLRAVRVVDRVVANQGAIERLAARTRRLLDGHGSLAGPRGQPQLTVEHGFFGGAYGRSTPTAQAAVELGAGHGVILEPTYTGKTLAALLADARAGGLDGQRVLFWHTFSSADLAPLLAVSPGPAALPPALRRRFEHSDWGSRGGVLP